MAIYKVYTGNPVFAGSDFYIHKRKRDIGKAANGNHMSDKDIAQVFSRQKEQAGEASKTHYKTLFLENLKLNNSSLALLSESFEEDTESIIAEIDKQLKQKLQATVNQQELEKLMGYYKSSAKASKDLLSGSREATAAFNSILQNLADATALIHGEYGAALASLLVYYKQDGRRKMSLAQMGERLSDAVSDFVNRNPAIPLDEAKIINAVQALARLGQSFSEGQTSTGRDIVKSNITKVVDSAFQTGFSEVIGSQLQSIAELRVKEELSKIVGSETVQVQKSDLQGYLTELQGDKAAGKTDILHPNVSVTIDKSAVTPNGGNIKMDIGISNKFYRSFAFPGASYDGQRLHFSSGSGGTLKEALETLFETDFQHYIAYNTLFQGASGLPAATIALQDILLTRQITRLFASRGGVEDFSQYVIVNGQVVSIWGLIQYALNNQVGLSASMDNDMSQGMVLHIQGRKEIFTHQSEKNARIRVPAVNAAINKATIMATVRVEKLITAIPETEIMQVQG